MSEASSFELRRGGAPLVISIPHLGACLPLELRPFFTPAARALADTDWHLDRLYGFAEALDATLLMARVSRYVIDLNRPVAGESLHPGTMAASACPVETCRGEALYREGCTPDRAEIERREATYWWPYHLALRSELNRLRGMHGKVLLWDAHAIAGERPRFSAGWPPRFNFGTADGRSCHGAVIAEAVGKVRATDFSWVLNGRIKGGFIVRRYGAPRAGVHAIHLEVARSVYMDDMPPFGWRGDRAVRGAPVVRAALEAALHGLSRLEAGPLGKEACAMRRG